MFERKLNLKKLVQKKSLFLIGPRQTGKTTLLKKQFPEAKYINLLEADTYREFYTRPEVLRQSMTKADKLVIIDEIQKIPKLLDEVHNLIESEHRPKFIMTGSSARSIKHGAANLLAGRAWMTNLSPLTSFEVGINEKNIMQIMTRGGLPSIYESKFFQKDLAAYVGTYLREEIAAEAVTRSVDRYSRFLDVAGFCSGEVINFTKVGSDCSVPPRTVIEYFKVLEDTLLGSMLEPFQTSKNRKSIASSKFYMFDLGVSNFLTKRRIVERGNQTFGKLLEHFIYCELKAYQNYVDQDAELHFWRSQSQFEVDFVWDGKVGIEVKSSERVNSHDEKGLHALAEEIPKLRKVIVCFESRYRKTDSGVEVFPVIEFLKLLWNSKFF